MYKRQARIWARWLDMLWSFARLKAVENARLAASVQCAVKKQLINNYRVIFSAVIGGKKAEGSPERSKLAARALLASTPGCACRAPALSFRVAEVLAAAIRWPACVTCSRTISCCAEHSRHFLRFVYWLFYDFLEKHACLPAIKTNISSVCEWPRNG